jgi:hypothetical protein
LARALRLTIFNGGVTEVDPGLGQEAIEQAGPVLHPPEPGLYQGGELADVLLGEVSQGTF